ncbi:MAG: biosynthetic arginine decarboxylase [Campylobacterales bacterium]|nr:biosynthetic arginine decarboxylase [Campylobacterales bacterium]
MTNYGLENWGEDNFVIEDGKVCINKGSNPAILDIVEGIRSDEITGPILLRFPHLIKKQIDTLFRVVKNAGKEYNYNGKFKALFPLKVNQNPGFIKELLEVGQEYNYGLEAGSKAELILAMAYNNKKAPLVVNGFKDRDLITMGFIAKAQGHDITLTIEGLGELLTIVEVAKAMDTPIPNIGIRIRLHTSGIGIWAKSGGINSKFGLTATEVVRALKILKENNLTQYLTMLHYHIGSQLEDITPVKKAIREAGNIYAELVMMGAENLDTIDLGGGLAVEYSMDRKNRTYSIQEFANDVCFLIKSICQNKGVKEPHIYSESGRFIAASHAMVVAPVLELFSYEYSENSLDLKETNPPLVAELNELYQSINPKNAVEFLHDALDHMESLLTLFDLGYIDLQDRSNTEVLVNLIIKKALAVAENLYERVSIREKIQERYLVNFSMFQSMPDFWGLDQKFPVMPLDRLETKPTRTASLWDITCDSDGEMSFKPESPLFLHDVDLDEKNYFLGFFLVGAYQEVLGMKHNLFSKPNEAVVEVTEDGYKIKRFVKSDSLLEILSEMDWDIEEIKAKLFREISEDLITILNKNLEDNGYLKKIN